MIFSRFFILATGVLFYILEASCLGEQPSDNTTNTIQWISKQVEQLIDREKYGEALPLAQQWLTESDTLNGPESTNSAMALSKLGNVREELGDFAAAEPLYLKCLQIREKVLGMEHPDTADAMNDLGIFYRKTGDYSAAERMYSQSLKIRERILGKENPDTADSMNNLAVLYRNMGNYAAAEPLFKQSLAIWEKTLGPDDSATATALNNLANLYYTIGNYTAAEPLFQRSLQIVQKTQGTNHLNTAAALNNLAELYQMLGNFTEAEKLHIQSLRILETKLGTDHPAVAATLNNLAELYRIMGHYAEAEPLYQRCLRIWESKLGPEQLNTSTAMNNLAVLNRSIGNYAAAEALFERSLVIYEKVLGDENSRTASCLNNLVLNQLGKDPIGSSNALSLARKATRANEHSWQNVLSFASDAQRSAFQKTQNPYLLFANLGSAPDLAEGLLRYKGVVLDSQIEDQIFAKCSKEPVIQKKASSYQEKGRTLLKFEMEVPKDQSPGGLEQRKQAQILLETEMQKLQSDLARNVASFAQTRRALRVTVHEVQSELTFNSALVEFLRYEQYLGKADWRTRYGAVVIGHANELVWVALGNSNEIEQNLKTYEEVMRGDRRGDAAILKTLYSQLMEPVIQHLPTNITTIIISPDAELNFLSFATLLDSHNKFLAESYKVKYVASGRDLVYGRSATNQNPELVVFADPQFHKVPGTPDAPDTNTVNLAMLSLDRRDYDGVSLAQLPNTAKEADFLKLNSARWHLKPTVFTGTEATEARVKDLHSPYILHLATHGFFLPDTTPTNQTPNLSLDRKMPIVLHNPMQRSGLALAGAQLTLDAWKRGEVPDTENDGILMAEEVGMLDLQNTWLVTLSACDTGIGEARAGEGVMGLRRGFIQAGCQNLLMTLWPVSDKWTVDLMKAFYEEAMKTGNAPDALADVQREFLIKLKKEKNAVLAARLAGPFVMSFQGKPGNN